MNKDLKIEVLGSGCPTCKSLYELTKKAVTELELNASVEYNNDITKMIEMGVMQGPVLAINNKPILTGSTTNIEKIKKAIIDEKNSETIKFSCDCGGNC